MPLRAQRKYPIVFKASYLGAKTLNVPQIAQEQTQWCWAGCADMVLHYYSNPTVRQCELANWLIGMATCCSAPSSTCNQPCQVNDVTRLYNSYGLQCVGTNGTVPFATLQAELDGGRPVEVAYLWNGGGGHVAVVRGWDSTGSSPFLAVNDPAYGSVGVYYSDLLTAYGQGTWFHTYTGIRR